MSITDSVVPDQSIQCRDRGGEVVLLDTNGRVYELDPVGAVVWRQLAQGRSLEWIAGFMAGRYELDTDMCSREVVAFAAMLKRHGLVQVSV